MPTAGAKSKVGRQQVMAKEGDDIQTVGAKSNVDQQEVMGRRRKEITYRLWGKVVQK
jgi:hypothetical protein